MTSIVREAPTQASTTGSVSGTLAGGGAPATNNHLVATVRHSDGTSTINLPGAGWVWAPGSPLAQGTGRQEGIAYKKVAGDSATVTFTATTTAELTLDVVEVSGLDPTATPTTAQNHPQTLNVAALTTGSTGTLAQADGYAVGVACLGGASGTIVGGSDGFTAITDSTTFTHVAVHKVTTAITALNPTITWTTLRSAFGMIAWFPGATPTAMPDMTVEVAFASTPDDDTPTWTDVTDYVEAATPISITRGRSDELTEVQPSRLSVMLDNSDGRFTPLNPSSPYFPNVRKNRRIRVSGVWPAGGTTYRRFTGYVDEWPVVWPTGTDQYSSVTITASSRRARLGESTELRSVIEEEHLADGPTAYYPLGEAAPPPGSPGTAGDVSGNQQPKLEATGSGTPITWQGADGPLTDGLSAPVFNNSARYLEMVANIPFIKSTDQSFTLEGFLTWTPTLGDTILTIGRQSNPTWIAITVNADGRVAANTFGDTIGSNSVLSADHAIDDGAVHHVAYRETRSGPDSDDPITQTLFVDGVAVDTDTYVGTAAFIPRIVLKVGDGYNGSLSHVAIFAGATQLSNARIAAHAESGLTGFSGESTDARIERLAGYAGIPPAEVSTETGMSTNIVNQETTGQRAIDLMDEVTETEGGILFDAGDGSLVFHSRDHRYNAASAFTLDASPSAQHIEDSLEARLDGQQLVNDVSVTGGSSLQIRVVNDASKTEHGVHTAEIQSLTLDDSELVDAANWRVQRYGEPDVRIQAVEVGLILQSSALITSLLDAELGDRITLANLPAQAPASSMDMFIDGISESIGSNFYTIRFDLTPVSQADVWQLNSASYSQLDQTTVLAY